MVKMDNPPLILMPSPPYRKNTQTKAQYPFFVFKEGGIGDYICHMACMEWIAQTQPQVRGTIIAPKYLRDFIQNIMAKYSHWQVQDEEYNKKNFVKNKTLVYAHKGQMQPNATGMHMIDLAFATYANVNPVPEGFNYYPILSFNHFRRPKYLRSIGPYIVMTPGTTTEVRELLPETFNEIKNHIIKKGFTPVFLGKAKMDDRTIRFNCEYNFEGGLDLRDMTSIMEAAYIMSKAITVVGLDNGLLHLAACTDASIIFGYNVASPEHRQPRRRNENLHLYEIVPDEKALPCTFCQSNMNFISHDFIKCIYKDRLCLTVLGNNKAALWKQVIDQAIKDRI